jgi:predicted SAM-dependent methyltransferase
VKLEIGAGEYPHEDFEVHADVLALGDIEVLCRLDKLPFKDASFDGLRASHVLEHQSWELVDPTLREWARVLRTGAEVFIGVPDAWFLARQWVRGELTTPEANYWMLGGHSDRPSHKGVDERGVPLWIWNAHHTFFNAEWLREVVEATDLFVEVDVTCYDERSLRCLCRRSPQ